MNPTPAKPPKCLIFDCDGILVDSEHITFSVLAEMSKEAGLELSEAKLEAKPGQIAQQHHHFSGG